MNKKILIPLGLMSVIAFSVGYVVANENMENQLIDEIHKPEIIYREYKEQKKIRTENQNRVKRKPKDKSKEEIIINRNDNNDKSIKPIKNTTIIKNDDTNKNTNIKKKITEIKKNNTNTSINTEKKEVKKEEFKDNRPKCSICGEGVGVKERCECDGTTHHRTCHKDAYTCPSCNRYGLKNDPNIYGCPYCGHPNKSYEEEDNNENNDNNNDNEECNNNNNNNNEEDNENELEEE